MGKLKTGTAGSRLATILTTAIVTAVIVGGGVALAVDTVGSTDIIDNSIRSVDIQNGQVKSADIGFGQVKTSDIGANQVTSSDIAANAVRGTDIKDGTITSADIAPDAVDSSKIADGTITSADIADGQITGTDIANETIDGSNIADGAFGSSEILDGAIGPVDLGAAAQPAGVAFADGQQNLDLTTDVQSVRSVVLDAPAPGYVIVTASAYTVHFGAGLDRAICTVTDGAIATDDFHLVVVDDGDAPSTSQQHIPFSATRTFAVPAGQATFRLVCFEQEGVVIFLDSQITALYVPQLYAP